MNMESDRIGQELVTKRKIWEKFVRHMKEWRRERASNLSWLMESLDMKPDVIVILRNKTMLLKPQTLQASEWLRKRCQLTSENLTGHTEFLVHPQVSEPLIAELKAAGFTVNN